MAFEIFVISAFLCSVHCNPLGQTTVCESGAGLLPNLLPNYGTTVCESAPNYLGLGALGYGWPGLVSSHVNPLPSATVCESTPNYMGLGALGLGIGGMGLPNLLGVGGTTVCNSIPNVGLGLGGLGGLGLPGLLGVGSSTTVCDSVPSVGLGLGLSGLLGMGGLGGTTVCESGPNYGLNHPLGLTGCSHPNLPLALAHLGIVNPLALQGLPLGHSSLGNLGSTTVCDTAPNMLGLGGLGLGLGLGRPFL